VIRVSGIKPWEPTITKSACHSFAGIDGSARGPFDSFDPKVPTSFLQVLRGKVQVVNDCRLRFRKDEARCKSRNDDMQEAKYCPRRPSLVAAAFTGALSCGIRSTGVNTRIQQASQLGIVPCMIALIIAGACMQAVTQSTKRRDSGQR